MPVPAGSQTAATTATTTSGGERRGCCRVQREHSCCGDNPLFDQSTDRSIDRSMQSSNRIGKPSDADPRNKTTKNGGRNNGLLSRGRPERLEAENDLYVRNDRCRSVLGTARKSMHTPSENKRCEHLCSALLLSKNEKNHQSASAIIIIENGPTCGGA